MSDIKNVILVGASGNLGPSVLNEFLKSKLNVAVLTRPSSTATFPPEVNVIRSSYDPSELSSALKGQDALISLVGAPAFGDQQKLIAAAVAAGVKRFVPSEFGVDTASERVRELVPLFGTKRAVVEELMSKEDKMAWTALVTGPFCDWGLKVGFLGFDLNKHTATIWDDGTVPFATTNVHTIGAALVSMLTNPDAYAQTANKYVYIASHVTTQNELLGYCEKVTGKAFKVTNVKTEEVMKAANEKLQKGDYSSAYDLIKGSVFGPEKLGVWEPTGNRMLGLPDETLEDDVRAVVEGRRP